MRGATASEARIQLMNLFDMYLESSLTFLRRFLIEIALTIDNNLTESLMRILDCFFQPYIEVEGKDPPTKEELELLEQAIGTPGVCSFQSLLSSQIFTLI